MEVGELPLILASSPPTPYNVLTLGGVSFTVARPSALVSTPKVARSTTMLLALTRFPEIALRAPASPEILIFPVTLPNYLTSKELEETTNILP